jgi:DNA-binding transcriptional LysR family regulator
MFTLQQLRSFCEVYKSRNMRQAAETVGVSRQAMGRTLSTLECELGTRLFDRSAGMAPSALAERMYPEAERIVSDAERLWEGLTRECTSGHEILRVGATFSALETTLPLLPIDFTRIHPSIDLEIIEKPDEELETMVAAGELDCAFVIGPAGHHVGCRSVCVHAEPLGMLMRTDDNLAKRERLSISDLDGIPLLIVSSDFKVRDQLLSQFARFAVTPKIAYTSNDFSLLVKMCRMGQGVVPLPRSRVEEPGFSSMTCIPFSPTCDPGWRIDFLWRIPRPEVTSGRAVETLLSYVKSRASKMHREVRSRARDQ